MNEKILRYEELAMNAFPAILTEVFDGWILRYSSGYTYRGNSVNPIYRSTEEFNKKIATCEEKYFSKGLPCVFKMTEQAEDGLDQILEGRGYKIQKNADIMDCKLTDSMNIECNEVSCKHEVDEEWLAQFLRLNDTTTEPEKSAAEEILLHIGNQVVCAAVYDQGECVACGLGVYEDEKIGLYDIRVDEKYRRKGYGTKVCKRIIEEGAALGAKTAYLQVASVNQIAITMYQKLGFERVYTYWYRVLENVL